MEQELLILPEHLSSPPVLSGFFVAQSLVFCVVFCRSVFVLFPFAIVFWNIFECGIKCHPITLTQPQYCQSFFDLGLMVTSLISSNFSYCHSSWRGFDIFHDITSYSTWIVSFVTNILGNLSLNRWPEKSFDPKMTIENLSRFRLEILRGQF